MAEAVKLQKNVDLIESHCNLPQQRTARAVFSDGNQAITPGWAEIKTGLEVADLVFTLDAVAIPDSVETVNDVQPLQKSCVG